MTDVQFHPGIPPYQRRGPIFRRAHKRQKIQRRSSLSMATNYADLVDSARHVSTVSGKPNGVPFFEDLTLPSPEIPLIRETCPSPLLHAKQSQHSQLTKSVVMSNVASSLKATPPTTNGLVPPTAKENTPTILSTTSTPLGTTPIGTAPNSPRIRPLTLDVPGLTKSKVSPDGKIAQRDIGAKLVIIMVGLPARGKSYITKKIVRYLNWLQHDAQIFNVGHRRRMAAGMDVDTLASTPTESAPHPPIFEDHHFVHHPEDEGHHMDQSSSFFDPNNQEASRLRERVAMETLDELLRYVCGKGSVGILDATNSTVERRKHIVDRIREVAGKDLGILFIESSCTDENLLEANMRLKLNGPDYKGRDPQEALDDFKKRVKIYEKSFVPVGDFEEQHGYSYIKMVDVGRKMIVHGKLGFLANQVASYLMNFNLAHRQIWITRHGESEDNVDDRIGGDANLTAKGRKFAADLAKFVAHHRANFREKQLSQHEAMLNGPLTGDITPPNPEYIDPNSKEEGGYPQEKNFCVWTSMLERSRQTGEYFDEEAFDVKEMRMLDELNAGKMDGLTYSEIAERFPQEFKARREDKLRYRYPGTGGESYLDVINRLRPIIHEVERMTEHVCLITHTVVARVLLAYFMNLPQEDVANLDVPLGWIYMLEPKPYGTEFKTYKHNPEMGWFDEVMDHDLRKQRKAPKISMPHEPLV